MHGIVRAGAAAASAGTLSPEVLAAMQATLSDSSIANAADQLADQEAQLCYLQESNAMIAMERDQLLSMNRKMMALLVQQCREVAAAVLADDGGSSRNISGGPFMKAPRRCLSLEVRQGPRQ
jgi:hypothetical protein